MLVVILGKILSREPIKDVSVSSAFSISLATPVWGFHARMIWNDDKYHFEKFLFTMSKVFMLRLGSSLFHI